MSVVNIYFPIQGNKSQIPDLEFSWFLLYSVYATSKLPKSPQYHCSDIVYHVRHFIYFFSFFLSELFGSLYFVLTNVVKLAAQLKSVGQDCSYLCFVIL